MPYEASTLQSHVGKSRVTTSSKIVDLQDSKVLLGVATIVCYAITSLTSPGGDQTGLLSKPFEGHFEGKVEIEAHGLQPARLDV